MSDITTQKTTILQTLLDGATCPQVVFKSSLADFTQAVNTIGDLIELKFPFSKDPENHRADTIAQVLEQYDALKQSHEYAGLFYVLNSMAASLGEHILSVFQILKTSVYPEVEALHERVNEQIKEQSRQDGTNITLLHDADITKELDQFSFVSLLDNLGGVEEITLGFNDLTGYEPTANINDITIALNVLRLSIKEIPLGVRSEQNSDTPLAKDDMIRRVKERMTEEVDDATLEKVLALISVPYDFQVFVANHLLRLTTDTDFCAILKHNVACLQTISPLVALFRSTPFNLPDEVLDDIHENIKQVEAVIFLMEYSVYVLSQIFQNALIMDEQTVNKEVFDQFIEQGGSTEDIVHFLFVYYLSKNIPVPSMGISIQDVVTSKETTEQEFAAITTSQKMNARLLLRNTMATVTRQALIDYLSSVEESRLPEDTNHELFVKQNMYLVDRCINMLDTQDESHLENCLFTFIIDLWYQNTVVHTAHELFGAETLRQLQVHNDLSEEQMQLIDARVAAALAAEFVTKNLCVKK